MHRGVHMSTVPAENTCKLNHDQIINKRQWWGGGSFIITFKIPSSWEKTNPSQIITHALLGVHKSHYAEKRGCAGKDDERGHKLFINLQPYGSFAKMQFLKQPFACTSALIPTEEEQKNIWRAYRSFSQQGDNGVTLYSVGVLPC